MAETYMQRMQKSSHLSGQSAAYIDELYEAYLQNPNSLPDQWRLYFDQLPQLDDKQDVSHAAIREYFAAAVKAPQRRLVAVPSSQQGHVLQLINAYRTHGHHLADLDPLGLTDRVHVPDLDLIHYGFTDADLDKTFTTESALTADGASLRDIVARLQRTYCSSIGVEYMHISSNEETSWIQQRFETVQGHPSISADNKREILQQLSMAEGLERHLHSKYVGQKRFSLEGGDSLIPLLHEIIQRAGQQKVREMIIGMAHRGRLNVLINVFGKETRELFAEFEGKPQIEGMTGDVKYHLGYSSDIHTTNGTVHLALAFNPSHLEIISPAVILRRSFHTLLTTGWGLKSLGKVSMLCANCLSFAKPIGFPPGVCQLLPIKGAQCTAYLSS